LSAFDLGLEFLAGVESHHPPRRNRHFFASLGIAAGALWLLAALEIAKTGQFDDIALFERQTDFIEEGLDNVLGFAFVQTHFFEQKFGQISFGKSGHASILSGMAGEKSRHARANYSSFASNTRQI
jgi:hypothetical protein